MSTLIEIVNSKYGDYKGNVSIDFQDQFFTRLKSLGFPKGVIVGTGFSFGEIKGECSLDTVSFYVLIASPEYGSTMQDVIDSIPDKGIKVQKVKQAIPVSELGKFIKRFNCCGIYKDIKGISQLDFDIQQ